MAVCLLTNRQEIYMKSTNSSPADKAAGAVKNELAA